VKTNCLLGLGAGLLLCSTGLCSAQVITVRVVNEKNRRPLAGQAVSVSLLYGKGENAPLKYDSRLQLRTDEKGEAKFTLPDPPPAHLWVGAGKPSEEWFCACATPAFASTQDVMKNGLLEKLPSKSSKIPEAKPGEIVFVARPYNLFYRLLAPLLKE
jgi:hypothetical protein